MSTITIQEAQSNLSQLIQQLANGDEIIITENEQPVARLLAIEKPTERKPRRLGTMKGTVLYIAPDFDAPLEDFREYME